MTNPRGIVDQVVAQPEDQADVRALQREIEGIMRVQRRLRPSQDNNFAVETAEDALAFWDEISRILFIALPGFGLDLIGRGRRCHHEHHARIGDAANT